MSLGILGATLAAPIIGTRRADGMDALARAIAERPSLAFVEVGGYAARAGETGPIPIVIVRVGNVRHPLGDSAAAGLAHLLRTEGRQRMRGDLIGLSAQIGMAMNDAHRACERIRAVLLHAQVA